MRHGFKKHRFGSGLDANRMLMRKLAYNFMKHGKIVTTEKKAKALASYIEVLVQKCREENTANKNFLLKKLGSVSAVKTLYNQVAPAVGDKKSGYLSLRRLHSRLSDGASMAEMKWSIPVIIEKKLKVVPKTVEDSSSAEKQEASAKPRADKKVKKKTK